MTESELLKQHTDTAVLSHAEHLMEEEKDEVKHMNHMVQYAKCVAIRDKQILVSLGSMGGTKQLPLDLLKYHFPCCTATWAAS